MATYHQNSDDQSEESDGAAEDLDDEDAHEERGVGSVGQRGARANLLYQKQIQKPINPDRRNRTDLSDAESADEVDDAGGEARAEHEVPGGPVAQLGLVIRRYDLGRERRDLQCGKRERDIWSHFRAIWPM